MACCVSEPYAIVQLGYQRHIHPYAREAPQQHGWMAGIVLRVMLVNPSEPSFATNGRVDASPNHW